MTDLHKLLILLLLPLQKNQRPLKKPIILKSHHLRKMKKKWKRKQTFLLMNSLKFFS